MNRVLLCLLLVCYPAFAEDPPKPLDKSAVLVFPPSLPAVVLSPPKTPIVAGFPKRITVTGLTIEEFKTIPVLVEPSDGVDLYKMQGIDGSLFIEFTATFSGKYTLTCKQNAWRGAYNEWLAAHKTEIPADLLKEFESLVVKSASYPSKFGTCVVEVAGSVPFPQPSPNDPNPDQPLPNNRVSRVTYVWDEDKSAVPHLVAKALQRLNADFPGSLVASEFEDSTVDGTGDVPEQYKVALEAARKAGLPALVIQSGSTVLRVITNPKTEQDVQDAVK